MPRRRTGLVVALVLGAGAVGVAMLAGRRPAPPPPPDFASDAPIDAMFAPAAAPAASEAGPREAAVQAASRTLAGRVVDADGAAIAGARVRLAPAWFGERLLQRGASAADLAARTDASGAFTFSAVHAEPNGLDVEVDHADHVSPEERWPLQFDAPATIVLRRVHEVPLHVRLHEQNGGVPVPSFRVSATTFLRVTAPGEPLRVPQPHLTSPNEAAGTDGEFRATARVVPGLPLHVRIDCAGYGAGEWSEAPPEPLGAIVQPVPGQPIELDLLVDFGLAEARAAAVQRGRVVAAATGAPIRGATVRTHVETATGWRSPRAVQSRADGSFALALPKDGAACSIVVEHHDWQSHTWAPQPELEPTVRLEPRASLRVRVVDATGTPMPGACLLVTMQARRRGLDFHERARTDAEGQAHFPRLLAGSYHVAVLAQPFDSDDDALAAERYAVAAGESADVTIATEPPDAVRVVGMIVGGAEGLVPHFVPHAGARRWIRAKTRGRSYDAGGVPRGDHLVLLLPDDGAPDGAGAIALPRIGVQGLGTLALDLEAPTGEVRGRVLAPGSAHAGWRVVAVPEVPAGGLAAELLAMAQVHAALGAPLAADGSFTLPATADGGFRLEIRDSARVVATRAATVRHGLDLGDWILP